MTYGLKVTTGASNNIIQIDSDIDMVNMPSISQNSAPSVPYSSTTPDGPNVIFINNAVTSGNFKTVIAWRDSNNIYFRERTNNFPQPQVASTRSIQTSTAAAAQSYVVMRDTTSLGSPTGTYGLIVNRTGISGPQTVFDSRYYINPTYSVTSVIDIGGRLGALTTSQKDTPITTNLSAYVSIYPSLVATTATLGSTDWYIPTGLIFSNNHSTMGTGIYYYGIIPSPYGGYTQLRNFAPLLVVT